MKLNRKKHMKVGENKSLHFPVVVTSFEILMIDRPHLERHLWQVRREENRIKGKGRDGWERQGKAAGNMGRRKRLRKVKKSKNK